MINPLIATITIIPTIPTSDTFRHDAARQSAYHRLPFPNPKPHHNRTRPPGRKKATGTVTFYNGLFTQQFIASGTVYTGKDGVAIVTTQDATISPGDPSSGYGTATVPAQAVEAGSTGNIQAGDVSITINNGLLVRNNQFHNGQDERTYTTVTQKDIHSVSTVLKTTLERVCIGALQGQLTSSEQLHLLPCTPTVTSDHQPGEEATTVKVTVSETCSAIAYNSQELQTKATAYLATQARHKAGAGYSLFGTVQVQVKQASVASTTTPPCVLIVSRKRHMGLRINTYSPGADQTPDCRQNHTRSNATLLAALPGVESAAIRLSGFGDNTRLPKTAGYIHITIFVV